MKRTYEIGDKSVLKTVIDTVPVFPEYINFQFLAKGIPMEIDNVDRCLDRRIAPLTSEMLVADSMKNLNWQPTNLGVFVGDYYKLPQEQKRRVLRHYLCGAKVQERIIRGLFNSNISEGFKTDGWESMRDEVISEIFNAGYELSYGAMYFLYRRDTPNFELMFGECLSMNFYESEKDEINQQQRLLCEWVGKIGNITPLDDVERGQ